MEGNFTLTIYQEILQRRSSLEALLECRSQALTLDGQHTIDSIMLSYLYMCACRQGQGDAQLQLQQELLLRIREVNQMIQDKHQGLADAALACGLRHEDVEGVGQLQ